MGFYRMKQRAWHRGSHRHSRIKELYLCPPSLFKPEPPLPLPPSYQVWGNVCIEHHQPAPRLHRAQQLREQGGDGLCRLIRLSTIASAAARLVGIVVIGTAVAGPSGGSGSRRAGGGVVRRRLLA